MKKAGSILIIIGIILSFISGIALVVTGIIMLVAANPDNKAEIMRGLQEGWVTTTFNGTVEEQAVQIQQLFQILGIVFFIIAAGYAINIIISSLAARGRSKGLYIATAVINVIFFNIILLLGAVFGLVGENEEISQ